MESELLEPCPVCGRGCEVVEGDDETGGVFCACGYRLDDEEMKGIAEDAIARHNALCRRAEIGALVERMCRSGSLDGPLKAFPSRLVDGPVRVSLATFAMGMRNGEAATLLDALRALAAELEPTDE